MGLGGLHQRLLEYILLLFKIVNVWLDLLKKDQAQSKQRFAVEFFDVFGAFDDV